MESAAKMNIYKNKAIVYCRLSRIPDASRGILSLDSQEFAIKNFLDVNGLEVFSVTKHVGSAYSTEQNELKQLLNQSRNKVLFVYEANRLSRNVNNFEKIWTICRNRRHSIGIVSMNRIFSYDNHQDYDDLRELIKVAEKESADMGARISRTAQYKKSIEPNWGLKRNEMGELVENLSEQKITRLIQLLGRTGSSVSEIRYLISEVGKTEGKDPFEIVEYTKGRSNIEDVVIHSNLPFPMSVKDIEETLKIYEVRKRRSRWSSFDINIVLASEEVKGSVISIDELSDDFEFLNTRQDVDMETNESVQEWITIWYDPLIGLPPHIRLPTGMTLPTIATTLYIPK